MRLISIAAFLIPIGIYAVTHQYSIGDTFWTFFGFVGLASPNFLSALILMLFFFNALHMEMRVPAVSWGVLLHHAQNVRSISLYPWVMIPALLVVIAVLAFNFLGDGLRDAANPYKA